MVRKFNKKGDQLLGEHTVNGVVEILVIVILVGFVITAVILFWPSTYENYLRQANDQLNKLVIKANHVNENGEEEALDTMIYSESEVRRIAKLAFEIAGERSKKVTSVDKANVLESSRLWRKTVAKLAEEYPEIELENLLVDAATMHLLSRPRDFDVMVTMNLFGDIITDEASMLTGSMGNMPSAALGEDLNSFGKPRGMYEPIHGSAPDIAGKGIANPIGMILSTAMMLRHSLGLSSEAEAIEKAVDVVLYAGARTADIVREGEVALGTSEMTEKILMNLG